MLRKNARILQPLLAFFGLAMVAVSLYLTKHYFEVHFPERLSEGSFCDISRFWNCDSAAFSPFSNILSVPTALFGAFFGLIIVVGTFFKNQRFVETNYFLAVVNLFGCLVLLLYSLIYLGGLCPGCTVYYVLSALIVLLFWRMKPLRPLPHLKLLFAYGLLGVAMMGATMLYNQDRLKKQEEVFSNWAKEIQNAQVFDDSFPDFTLPLFKSTNNFAEAPLRITLFSDFQCPFCKILGHELQKIASRYRGQLNIRYIFWPLDKKCNKEVSGEMHPHACSAARLAYCGRENFETIHDTIYEHQAELSEEWIKQKSEELKLTECFANPESEGAVEKIIDSAAPFSINAAPTMLINGRKTSGLIPAKALVFLLDSFLNAKEQAH